MAQDLRSFLDLITRTRPADFQGWRVPDVLLSGDHAGVERWRKEHVR